MLHTTSSGITFTACKLRVMGDYAYYYIIYDRNYMWTFIISWKNPILFISDKLSCLWMLMEMTKSALLVITFCSFSRARTILTIWWISSCLGPKLGPHWSSVSNHSVFTRYLCPCQEFLFLCVLFYSLPWKAESQNIFWVAKACLFFTKTIPKFYDFIPEPCFQSLFHGSEMLAWQFLVPCYFD